MLKISRNKPKNLILWLGFRSFWNPGKFHQYSICGCQVIYVQSFSNKENAGFLAAFEWFLIDYKPKSNLICTKLSSVMQSRAMCYICYRFWCIIKNLKKWTQKNNIWGFFQSFFGHPLSIPMCNTQIFCKIKVIMKICNRGMFHVHSICGSQVISFQSLL